MSSTRSGEITQNSIGWASESNSSAFSLPLLPGGPVATLIKLRKEFTTADQNHSRDGPTPLKARRRREGAIARGASRGKRISRPQFNAREGAHQNTAPGSAGGSRRLP